MVFIESNCKKVLSGSVIRAIRTMIRLEAISKKGFWFKFAAGPSLKPQAYSSISRILNEAPTKKLGQKTFLRWLLLCLLGLVATVSCTVISRQVRSEAEPPIPFKTLLEEAEKYIGRTVILGGYILQTKNLESETILKVLQAPFRVGEEPDLRDLSQGRFVVYFKGFLDPEVYARDRAITVAGTVIGSDVEKIGDEQVRYLKIEHREIYLWPEFTNLPPYRNPRPYPRYWHGYPNYPYSFGYW